MSRCPYCAGEVLAHGDRAWCIEPYANGGCGSYFFRERAGWMRQDAISDSVWGDRRPGAFRYKRGPWKQTETV